MRSMVARMIVTASFVAGSPSRNLPIKVSAACASASRRGRPRKPQVLDRMNEPKDVIENFGVVRILFKAHEFDVDHVETLVRLGHEFAQQVVHEKRLRRRA